MVKWLGVHLLSVGFMLLMMLIASAALADRFVQFQLCKHKTGKPLSSLTHDGIETFGTAYVSTALPVVLVAIAGVECTLIDLRTGGRVTVMGDVHEVHCKLRGGPDCKGCTD